VQLNVRKMEEGKIATAACLVATERKSINVYKNACATVRCC
jgi:hypothetical protein